MSELLSAQHSRRRSTVISLALTSVVSKYPHFGEGGPILVTKARTRRSSFQLRRSSSTSGLISSTTVPTEAQRAAVTDPVIQQLLPLIPTRMLARAVFWFGHRTCQYRSVDN